MDHGVGQRDVIAIAGHKKLAIFVSVLACLKIGAIYTVFDPDSPIERLRKILSRADPKLILAGSTLVPSLKRATGMPDTHLIDTDAEFLDVVADDYDTVSLPETQLVTSSAPAYIMFTSGSTGFPKGAVITHGNVLNLIAWN